MGGNASFEAARDYGEVKYRLFYGETAAIPSGMDIYAAMAEFSAYDSTGKFIGKTRAEIMIYVRI